MHKETRPIVLPVFTADNGAAARRLVVARAAELTPGLHALAVEAREGLRSRVVEDATIQLARAIAEDLARIARGNDNQGVLEATSYNTVRGSVVLVRVDVGADPPFPRLTELSEMSSLVEGT